MDAMWGKIKTTNEEKVREKCENTLHNLSMKYLGKNIENGEYKKAGGHRRYKRDMERIKDEYVGVLRDFKENEILSTWYGFVESMTQTEAEIVEADENMSQQEKEAEQKRNQEKLEELSKKQQKAHDDALKQQRQDLANHYEKLEKDRREQEAKDQEKYKSMVTERLEKEAAQKEVEQLQKQQEDAKKEAERLSKEREEAQNEADVLKDKEIKRKQKWFGARMWNALRKKD
ncbi:uncharacterized protein LOC132756383 [Ruditapes philippinarum]|uniref:uncharacterized protein LOC132756383 n=1 Tax=Ruditapes philippinarum TaxID=129788 RepID=UPI00295A66CE|nr:uncharacterized protein LOC132756383 [Ruditapes philippinarum]